MAVWVEASAEAIYGPGRGRGRWAAIHAIPVGRVGAMVRARGHAGAKLIDRACPGVDAEVVRVERRDIVLQVERGGIGRSGDRQL